MQRAANHLGTDAPEAMACARCLMPREAGVRNCPTCGLDFRGTFDGSANRAESPSPASSTNSLGFSPMTKASRSAKLAAGRLARYWGSAQANGEPRHPADRGARFAIIFATIAAVLALIPTLSPGFQAGAIGLTGQGALYALVFGLITFAMWFVTDDEVARL